MSDRSERQAANSSAIPQLDAALGPPALVRGEDAAAYETLVARVCATVRPADVLEEIWVRDVVDLVWEALRLRRLQASFMSGRAQEGVLDIIGRVLTGSPVATARQLAEGDVEAVHRVKTALAEAGLTLEDVTARSLVERIADLERIARMITSAEARRHRALHEIDRHRVTLALQLRRAIAGIEEAEQARIATQQLPATAAA